MGDRNNVEKASAEKMRQKSKKICAALFLLYGSQENVSYEVSDTVFRKSFHLARLQSANQRQSS